MVQGLKTMMKKICKQLPYLSSNFLFLPFGVSLLFLPWWLCWYNDRWGIWWTWTTYLFSNIFGLWLLFPWKKVGVHFCPKKENPIWQETLVYPWHVMPFLSCPVPMGTQQKLEKCHFPVTLMIILDPLIRHLNEPFWETSLSFHLFP